MEQVLENICKCLIIYNKIIPFKGYVAINLFGILFARKEYKGYISNKIINHERIHTAQMKELLFIFFYLWYVIEWLIFLVKYKNLEKAYRNISFEKEAYNNENNLEYLKTRKHYAFLRFSS